MISPAKASSAMIVKTLVIDVGIPYLVYVAATLAGAPDVVALAVAGGVSALRAVVSYLRDRRINALSVLMLIRFTVGIVVAILTGDATAVLVKDPMITATMGAVILASLMLRRPLTYYIRRDFVPDGMSWDAAWRQSSAFRRQNRTIAFVWGAGLVAESLLRIGIVLAVPVRVAALASPLCGAGCVLLLFAWMNSYLRGRRSVGRR